MFQTWATDRAAVCDEQESKAGCNVMFIVYSVLETSKDKQKQKYQYDFMVCTKKKTVYLKIVVIVFLQTLVKDNNTIISEALKNELSLTQQTEVLSQRLCFLLLYSISGFTGGGHSFISALWEKK